MLLSARLAIPHLCLLFGFPWNCSMVFAFQSNSFISRIDVSLAATMKRSNFHFLMRNWSKTSRWYHDARANKWFDPNFIIFVSTITHTWWAVLDWIENKIFIEITLLLSVIKRMSTRRKQTKNSLLLQRARTHKIQIWRKVSARAYGMIIIEDEMHYLTTFR